MAGSDRTTDRTPDTVTGSSERPSGSAERTPTAPLPDPDYQIRGHEDNLAQVSARAAAPKAPEAPVDDEDDEDADAEAGGVEDDKEKDKEGDEEDEDEDEEDGVDGKKPGGEEEETGEEKPFWSNVLEYWSEFSKENPDAGGWTTFLAVAAYALKISWGSESDENDDELTGPDGTRYRFENLEPDIDVKDPEARKVLEQAKKQFEGVKKDHEDWIGLTQKYSEEYKLGPKGPSIILAMSRFESGFNPKAKSSLSSATGLGQFVKGTWGAFQDSLEDDSELKGKPATDPEAAIAAIAWYSAENMEACGLKPDDPHLAARLYETHHEGAAGAKKLWKFRDGGPEGKIPASYKDKKFPKFGVDKVETYKDYSDLVAAMSSRVELVATDYEKQIS